MEKKKVTSIRVPAELLKKAQDLGLNVSKVCENALKEVVEKLEAPKPETGDRSAPERGPSARWRMEWDLNT